MARRAGIGRGIGNSPVNHLANGIVGAAKAPGGCGARGFGSAAPCFIGNGIIGTRGGVEPPDFFAGSCVVRGDVAIRARSVAGAAR